MYIYESLSPPNIIKVILKKLLKICTTEVPFKAPDGKYFIQIDGISMGNPLGPTFSEFYMSYIENTVFSRTPKPRLYVRYVDDILVLLDDENHIKILQTEFQNVSVLKFTYELNINNTIPFLDVLVDNNQNEYITTPYKKPTSQNSCLLNFQSECPSRYKEAVIKNFIKRAESISSSRNIFFKALSTMKQMLINNNFPNTLVDQQIRTHLNKQTDHHDKNSKPIDLFYCNQMTAHHKHDENTLKNIIKNSITPTDPETHIRIIIYYRKFKTSNLLVRNSPPPPSPISQSNVVYKFTCPLRACSSKEDSYNIGYTRMTLSRRLSYHLSDTSAISQHITSHKEKPTRDILVNNTEILNRSSCFKRLEIMEALHIKSDNPALNKINFTSGDNVLKLYNH